MEITALYTAEKHNDGAEMRVCDQFNKPLDLWLTLAGQDSEVWNKANREKQQKAFKRLIAKDEDGGDDDLEYMVNATLGWRGFEQAGAPLEFSKENARQLYKQAPYVLDQCILFINNRANFTKD